MGKRKGPKKASSPKSIAGVQASGSKADGSPASSGSVNVSPSSIEALASQNTASVTKIQDPISDPISGSGKTTKVNVSPSTVGSFNDSQTSEKIAPQTTASESKLQDPIPDQTTGPGNQDTVETVKSVKVAMATNPENTQDGDTREEGEISPTLSKGAPENEATAPVVASDAVAPNETSSEPQTGKEPCSDKPDLWTGLFKGTTKKLQKRGESFLLPSGESCVTIPNSVIEKNRKSWDSFIIGQFYSDPPSQGTIQTIVNGIWSKQFRDITVSKMEGFAFLFRIPNASTRAYVLKQCLWQIEGQTMFVAKWEPGIVPTKPELTTAPIWLELRDVPLQFFNEDALEQIASQVGDPKFLHPHTANKTNLEVAKVFTIIDPRVPLPEAVNARFESGEVRRIRVSSPWMPPVCSFCKEVGHSLRRCKKAPITCKFCKSTGHLQADCTRTKGKAGNNEAKIRTPPMSPNLGRKPPPGTPPTDSARSSLRKSKDTFSSMEKGGTSNLAGIRVTTTSGDRTPKSGNSETSPASSDSSDIDSPESPLSEDLGFEEVISSRQKKKDRGRGPKLK